MMPWYVKKEDAREVIRGQRIMVGIILISLAVVNWVMERLVVPKMEELMGTVPRSNMWLSMILIAGGGWMIAQKPDYSRVDNIVKKYQKGEMIKTRILMDWKYEWVGIGAALLMVLYLIYTIVIPISNLYSVL